MLIFSKSERPAQSPEAKKVQLELPFLLIALAVATSSFLVKSGVTSSLHVFLLMGERFARFSKLISSSMIARTLSVGESFGSFVVRFMHF